MKLRERLVRRLGRDILADVAQTAARSAAREALAEASMIDTDDHLWRSLGEAKRDLLRGARRTGRS